MKHNKSISLLAINNILLTAMGLAVIPSLNHEYAGSPVSALKNKVYQGEHESDVKGGGLNAPNDADINNRCYAVAA